MSEDRNISRSIDPLTFLKRLYDPNDEFDPNVDGYISIWDELTRKVTFHETVEGAVYAAGRAEGAPFYNVGTRNLAAIKARAVDKGKSIEYLRGNADETLNLPCIYADVDFAKEGSDKNYPPDEEAAMAAVLDAVGITPTLTVWTGGGVHLLWCFSEGLVVAARAGKLCRVWQQMIRDEFSKHEWDLDSTHDCTRVLRLPGFTHPKYPDAGSVSWAS